MIACNRRSVPFCWAQVALILTIGIPFAFFRNRKSREAQAPGVLFEKQAGLLRKNVANCWRNGNLWDTGRSRGRDVFCIFVSGREQSP